MGNDCKIILTTSGMGTYGPAQLYLPEYIKRPNTLIHFTGFTPQGTLGYTLKHVECGQDVKIGGMIRTKSARVEYTSEYSAHAKADEMIRFLQQFKNIKLILVQHGEEPVKEMFAKRIRKEVSVKDVEILGRDKFYRINPYGLVKVLPSKFD